AGEQHHAVVGVDVDVDRLQVVVGLADIDTHAGLDLEVVQVGAEGGAGRVGLYGLVPDLVDDGGAARHQQQTDQHGHQGFVHELSSKQIHFDEFAQGKQRQQLDFLDAVGVGDIDADLDVLAGQEGGDVVVAGAGEGDHGHFPVVGGEGGLHQVAGVAVGAEQHQHVPGPGQGAQLAAVDLGEIRLLAEAGGGHRVRSEEHTSELQSREK